MLYSSNLIVLFLAYYGSFVMSTKGNWGKLTTRTVFFQEDCAPNDIGNECLVSSTALCGCVPSGGEVADSQCMLWSALDCANPKYCENHSECASDERCVLDYCSEGFFKTCNRFCRNPCDALINANSCDVSEASLGLTQGIAQKCMNDGHISELNPEIFKCAGDCTPYLSNKAAASLNKIASQFGGNRKMYIERAFESVAERYLTEKYNAVNNTCSSKQLKVMNEDPVAKSHRSGCAIDLTPSSAAFWADYLISKGWQYTRPTIYTHHFEFLKCTDVEEQCTTAAVAYWNERRIEGVALDPATNYEGFVDSLATVGCSGLDIPCC